ncbi:MAG: hypothetical protein Q9178_005231 [Gyalolechia marmorata]
MIEQTLVDLTSVRGKIHVERSRLPQQLSVAASSPEDRHAYPVTVEVCHLRNDKLPSLRNTGEETRSHLQFKTDEDAAAIKQQRAALAEDVESIHAKYLVACDGAHSWTRRQLGLPMEGDQSESVWGVIDIIPLTNFPDIRQGCYIHSATEGSILNIPRENRINRLYIQLGLEDNTSTRSKITPRTIIAAAQRIMAPYTIDYKVCDWWSVYKIGQRLSPKFSVQNRIFLAGDAVHTHSPKLGQGMNVSMQDAYNLGWKIGAVVTGRAKPAILQTYEVERRQVALDLLETDRQVARLYSRRSMVSADNATKTDSSGFGSMRERMSEFLAGVGITYGESLLVAAADRQVHMQPVNGPQRSIAVVAKTGLASGVKLGARMPSYKVLNQAEARPIELADMLPSDGRWRLLVFAGDLKDKVQSRRISNLGQALAAPKSLLHRYRPSECPLDSVIEVLTIHSSPRTETSLQDIPDIFHPYDQDRGWDYWKMFVDDIAAHENSGNAYARYGIDRRDGCLIVCRPDQHVGYIGALEDLGEVEKYFEAILVPQI